MENDGIEEKKSKQRDYVLPISILISTVILAGTWIYTAGLKAGPAPAETANILSEKANVSADAIEEQVLPSKGVELPATWGDLGSKLVSAGAIDVNKLEALYKQRGSFPDEYKNMLTGNAGGKIKINNFNSGYLLNLFWALGLANKNSVLETGEMQDPKYGGAQVFASTAGWTMSKGDPMDHYSKHGFITLTAEQQALVDKVSRGVFRPCCGNSTHFPDCNHGMAMLGLLELMASQGASETEMWKAALAVNSYWFPSNYLTIATFMKNSGVDWSSVNPQQILGNDFSSAQGFARVSAQVKKPQENHNGGGGGCGV